MSEVNLSKHLIVADALDRWPVIKAIFLNHRMGCIGCPMAPFETLAEVANIYNLVCLQFISELQISINKK